MKKYKFLSVILTAALLCGCSNKDSSSQTDSSISVSSAADSEITSTDESSEISVVDESKPESSDTAESSAENSSDSPDVSEPDNESVTPNSDESFLVGLAGDRILKSEISTVFTNNGSDCAPADLTEEIFSGVLCDGFVYIAEPSKTARNDRDNENVYDSANKEFTDMTSEPVKNYVRMNVGDTVCGLTLKEAQVNFARGSEQMMFELKDGSQKLGSELGMPEIFFNGGSAKFEGEIVMNGYICCAAKNDYGIGVGEIVFVPSDGEANFPIMSYRLDGDNGFHHITQVYSLSDLTWQNEFGYMHLGNANSTTADISALPDNGSFIKAQVTVNNFELSCGVNFVNTVKADIVDVTEA